MPELSGWLLDLYEHPQDEVVLWLLADDGRRVRLRQTFPLTFYAAAEQEAGLQSAQRYLESQPLPVELYRARRRDLFQAEPLDVLAVRTRACDQSEVFRQLARRLPDLAYYDSDLPLGLHHAARFDTFPLARCRIDADADGNVRDLQALDSAWEIDPQPAPLRILQLEPDCDPGHAPPRALLARFERYSYELRLDQPRPLLINLRALLTRHDPDLLLTGWGDTWLLPLLLELSRTHGLPLPLNRDERVEVGYREERSYFSYGQVVFRGQQVHLFGRWHIDHRNAMLWDDYGIEGVLESARVTGLPVQVSARNSPGGGISAMQIRTALQAERTPQGGILVPWHKQQVEQTKTALDLLHSDQGGMIYQPLVGLHQNVAELDFVSMYPSIMVHCNISPEVRLPGGLGPSPEPPGLIPLTLAPLLQKRVALKRRLSALPAWDPRRRAYKAYAAAHKWLLVTCFGYLGYKNARFGRIEAHEAVTSCGREALLRAKEAAEDMGFTVLHMYVDGVWAVRPDTVQPQDFEPLIEEITRRTGLPLGLDGVFRWVVFLPSRLDSRVPVANRYFGVFQDGSIKVRGLEARRRDTPVWIAGVQMEMIERMAQVPSAAELPGLLPELIDLLRLRLDDLRSGRVPLEDLLVGQRITRELDEYTTPTPAARAAAQLEAVGKHLRPGQRVRFLHLRGQPDVHAWNLPEPPDPARLDINRYRTLLMRAASAVVQPLGVKQEQLEAWVDGGYAVSLPYMRC
ncbi:MAG: DNA polymerase domain-containing protein [Bellilinea sp.]